MLIWDCVLSGLCPFGMVCFRDSAHSGLCPFGIVSIRDGVLSGLCSFGMVSFRDCVHSGWCPFGIVSIRDCVHSGWCPFGIVSIRDRVQDPVKLAPIAIDSLPMHSCTVCFGATCGNELRQLPRPNRYYDVYNDSLIFCPKEDRVNIIPKDHKIFK